MATASAISNKKSGTNNDKRSVSWKQALVEKSRFIRLRGLSPEMLTDEGTEIQVNDEEWIHFDIEFVFHVINERILKPLGLVSPDGSVKEKYITQILVPQVISYAKTESERESQRRRFELATLMSHLNGRSIDENLELLRLKDQEDDEM